MKIPAFGPDLWLGYGAASVNCRHGADVRVSVYDCLLKLTDF